MLLLLYTLNQQALWSSHSLLFIATGVIAVVAFISFTALQIKSASPLLPPSLFSHRQYTGCCLATFLEQFVFSTLIVAIGIFLQKVMQFNALHSSILFLFMTVIFGVVATFGGRWIDKIGLRIPTTLGLLLMALGILAFKNLNVASSMYALCNALFIIGLGMGLAFVGLNTAVVKDVEPEQIGIASSVFLVVALLGNAFGVTITTLLYATSSRHVLTNLLPSNLNADQAVQLTNYLTNFNATSNDLMAFLPELQLSIMQNMNNALTYAIGHIMLLAFFLTLVAAMITWKLFKKHTVN